MSRAPVRMFGEVKLARLFEDDRTFWRAGAIVFGIVSFCKGIRLPNRWGATQAQVDYHYGLVKRGLFGEALGHWFHLEHYTHFVFLSYVLLAAFFILLIRLAISSQVMLRLGSGEAVALFSGSFAVSYLAYLVGYMDIALGALTVVLLLLKNVRMRFLAAVPACLFAMLIHEGFLLVFLPVILLSFIADTLTVDRPRRTEAWWMAVFLACESVAVALKLALRRPMTPQMLSAMHNYIASRVDFPLRNDVFMVWQNSMADNLKFMEAAFRDVKGWGFQTFVAAMIFLPTIFLLSMAILSMIRRIEDRGERRILGAAAAVAMFSPILMYLFACDNARWDMLICLNCFLTMLVLCRGISAPLSLPRGFRNGVVLAIALSMATGESLMDSGAMNTFPFSRAIRIRAMVRFAKHPEFPSPEH